MERKISFVGRPISFQPIFVTLTGSHTAAIMLSQMCYWAETKPDGKFWKTIEQWENELLLSRDQQERARKAIIAASKKSTKPWYTETREGVPAKLYHHLDIDALVETCVFMHRQRPRREPNASLDNLQAQALESHTSMREFPHTRVLETLHPRVSEIPHSITETTTENTYIDYPPTNHSVVDTAPGTGKPNTEENEDLHLAYEQGFTDGSENCTYSPESYGQDYRDSYNQGYSDGVADRLNSEAVGVVGGSLSNIGEERPASRTAAQTDEFYDGEASSESECFFEEPTSFFADGYRDAVDGNEPDSDQGFEYAEDYGVYMDGYNAGVRHLQRKATQVKVVEAQTREEAVVVNTTSISRAADVPPAASTSLVQPRKGTSAVETPPSPEIAAEMAKYDRWSDSQIYIHCRDTYAWDEAWSGALQRYYGAAKTNPLRYVRDMCLRRIRQTLEMEAQGLKDEKPKEMLVFPEVRNRDPKRAEKIAAYEKVDPEAQARAEETGRLLGERALAKARAKRAAQGE